jgi:hypothetical protein
VDRRWTGASFASLYELETTLKQVVSDLALATISAKDTKRIRDELGAVIGRGLTQIEFSKTKTPSGRLDTKSIGGALRTIAKKFHTAEPLLRGHQTGFRHSHQIQVALNIRRALAKDPLIRNEANEFLNDFCTRLNSVSRACLVAARDLTSIKRKRGQKPIDWYDDFTRVLIFIAGLNKIRTTIETDRGNGKPKGRFLSLAAGFERLIYPEMRSPSNWAMAKRLSNSLGRVKKGKNRSGTRRILSL